MNVSANIIRDQAPEGCLIPLKASLTTTVGAFTPQARQVSLASPEGKRRLFKHRAWPTTDPGHPNQELVLFAPGWLSRTQSGRACIRSMAVIPAGTFETFIQQVQAAENVHLWVAPVKLPTTPYRGDNWDYPFLQGAAGPEAAEVRAFWPYLPRDRRYRHHLSVRPAGAPKYICGESSGGAGRYVASLAAQNAGGEQA